MGVSRGVSDAVFDLDFFDFVLSTFGIALSTTGAMAFGAGAGAAGVDGVAAADVSAAVRICLAANALIGAAAGASAELIPSPLLASSLHVYPRCNIRSNLSTPATSSPSRIRRRICLL